MKKGFTLIELLIVVLIIGVLTAVAIPMYQGAVDKSHWSTLLPSAKAFKDAEEAVLMSGGNYTSDPENLGVSLDSDDVTYTLQTVNNGDDFNRVRGVNSKLANVRLSSYLDVNTYLAGQLHCEAKSGDSRAERLCHRLLDGQQLFTTDDGYVSYLLDQKIDASTCDYAGKYWSANSGSCHDSAEEACTADGGTYSDICYESEQAACEGNGGTWNGSECGDACEGNSCLSQEECEDNGWTYIDNTCYDSPEDACVQGLGGQFTVPGGQCCSQDQFIGYSDGNCYDSEEAACTHDYGTSSGGGIWDGTTCYGSQMEYCESMGMYWATMGDGCYSTQEEAEQADCDNMAGYWDGSTCYYPGSPEYEEYNCSTGSGYWDGTTCYWGGEEEACSANGGIYDGMCYEDPNEYCSSWGMEWNGSECYTPDDDDPLLGFLLSHFDPASSSVVFPVTDFAALLGDNASCGGGMCSTKNDIVGEEDCNSIGGSYSDGGCSNFSEGVVCYLLGSQYNTTANYSDGNCVLAVD